MPKITKVDDLQFDNKNFNKGTKKGSTLMEKSLKKFGAARSILIDKNGKIIAGNKTTQAFKDQGLENIQVVQTDGKTLIAVQRNDIDLDTKEGRELALADNQTAKKNLSFDFNLMSDELPTETLEDWDITIAEEEPETEEEPFMVTPTYKVEVSFKKESQLKKFIKELAEKEISFKPL